MDALEHRNLVTTTLRLKAHQVAHIRALAERCYGGNISAATRTIVEAGIDALEEPRDAAAQAAHGAR